MNRYILNARIGKNQNKTNIIMSKWEYLKWTNEDLEAILNVYGRDSKTIKDDIRAIDEWASKQPHLQKYRNHVDYETAYVLALIFNKFRIELTKSKMDFYFSARKYFPEFFNKMNNKYLEKSFKSVYVLCLPVLTKDYGRIYICKLNETHANLFDLNESMIRIFKMIEIRIRYDICLHDYYVLDCKGLTMFHIKQFNFVICKKFNTLIETMSCLRCKGIYLLNAGKIVEGVVTLFKQIINKKLADRISTSGDGGILFDLLPENEVPSDYGGTGLSLKELSEAWTKKYEEIDDWLEFLSNNPVDESLRPGKQLDAEFFGIDGHFRQLNVD